MADIFVSYVSKDRERIRPLVDALEQSGLTVWWDQHIRAGQQWDRSIEQALNDARCVVAVLTRQSIDSTWVRSEAMAALDANKLVPVLLDDVEVPLALRTVQCVRLSGIHRDDEARLLVEAVQSHLASVPRPVSTARRKRRLNANAMALVVAFVLVAAGAWWGWDEYTGRLQPADAPSILVLPFQNLSDSPDTDYFAAGVHEDVLSRLTRIEGLNVISRTTALTLAASGKSVVEIAEAAGVTRVLEGSIRRTGDRVRLTVQLIAAPDEHHLWAETYDRKMADIFAVQDELAQSIAEQLRIRLDPRVVEGFAKAPTKNIEAYDLLLRSRDMKTRDPAGSRDARVANLERAIELDPNYADAYAALAAADFPLGSNYAQLKPAIMQNIQKALSLDPENAHGLTAMAYVLTFEEGRPDLGVVYMARALAAEPGNSLVQIMYANHSADHRERWRHTEEAYRLDPLGNQGFYSEILLAQRRFPEALAAASRSAAFAPRNPGVFQVLARVYFAQGDAIAGLRQLRHEIELGGNRVEYVLRLSAMGQDAAAWRWLEAIEPGPFPHALLLLFAGRTEELAAFLTQWLAESPDSPDALYFYACLQAQRADEAFDRGDTAAQQAHLADALSAFHNVPFFADDSPGFSVLKLGRVLPRIRWLTVARQAGDDALANKLQLRLTEILTEQVAPEEQPLVRAMVAALAGDRDKAIEEFERAIVPGQWCLQLLEANGVLVDRGGVFHGVAADPRFQQLITAERQRRIELNDRIAVEGPELLEPIPVNASKATT